jgi:hypothetical protein
LHNKNEDTLHRWVALLLLIFILCLWSSAWKDSKTGRYCKHFLKSNYILCFHLAYSPIRVDINFSSHHLQIFAKNGLWYRKFHVLKILFFLYIWVEFLLQWKHFHCRGKSTKKTKFLKCKNSRPWMSKHEIFGVD